MEHPLHAGFVAVYLLALVGVGALKARKVHSQEDFSLAGRGLPTFVLVGTLLATWIGTGSLFGNAEKTFEIGVPALLVPIAGGLGILALYFLASRIRSFGQFTIQDILEARFGVWARVLATGALLSAYVIIVSYQYRAGAVVLGYVFPELPEAWAVVAVALFVVVYTALAGMYSVAYTDVANGVMMVVGIALAVPYLLSEAGGWSTAVASLPEGSRALTDHWTALGLAGVLLPSFLLLVGDANMYQRFFSARSPAAARRSALWMFVGVVTLELAIIAMALLASALVHQGQLPAPEKAGHILIAAAFHTLPTWLGASLVATAVAVVVSTADSYLLAPATSMVRDVYQRFLRPRASDRQVVRASRLCVVGLGLLALGLAFTSDRFFDVALFAYTIYGCAITPVLLAAFFWRRANHAGAVASITVGALVALTWDSVALFGSGDAPAAWALHMRELLTVGGFDLVGELNAVLVAFPLSLLALVVVSLLTPPPAARKVRALNPRSQTMSFYDLTPNALGGRPRPLSEFAGRVSLVVNVASECGYTPQYAGLQALHTELAGRGFQVLGFPSNEFGAQEPGDAATIERFCQVNFGVTFPLFEKCRTQAGSGQSPVYALLGEATGSLPAWNFAKYLVGRDGRVLGYYESGVAPDDAVLRADLEAALDAPSA